MSRKRKQSNDRVGGEHSKPVWRWIPWGEAELRPAHLAPAVWYCFSTGASWMGNYQALPIVLSSPKRVRVDGELMTTAVSIIRSWHVTTCQEDVSSIACCLGEMLEEPGPKTGQLPGLTGMGLVSFFVCHNTFEMFSFFAFSSFFPFGSQGVNG